MDQSQLIGYIPKVIIYERKDSKCRFWMSYYLPNGKRSRRRCSNKKKEAELKALRNSSLDWTSIRPPLISKNVNGSLHVDNNQSQGFKVDVSQLAEFMLDNLEINDWIAKAPFVGTK